MKIHVPFFEVIADMEDVSNIVGNVVGVEVIGNIVISISDDNILLDDDITVDITVDIGVQLISIIQKYRIVIYNIVY